MDSLSPLEHTSWVTRIPEQEPFSASPTNVDEPPACNVDMLLSWIGRLRDDCDSVSICARVSDIHAFPCVTRYTIISADTAYSKFHVRTAATNNRILTDLHESWCLDESVNKWMVQGEGNDIHDKEGSVEQFRLDDHGNNACILFGV